MLVLLLMTSACADQVTFEHDHLQDRENPLFIVRSPSLMTIVPPYLGVGVAFKVQSPQANVDRVEVEKSVDGGEFRPFASVPFRPDVFFTDTTRITTDTRYRARNVTDVASGPMVSNWVSISLPTFFLIVDALSLTSTMVSGSPGVNYNHDLRAPSFARLRIRLIQEDHTVAHSVEASGNPASQTQFRFFQSWSRNLPPTNSFRVRLVAESYLRLNGRDSVLAQHSTPTVYLPFAKGGYIARTERVGITNFFWHDLSWTPYLPSTRTDLSYRVELDRGQNLWQEYHTVPITQTQLRLTNPGGSISYRLRLTMGDSLHPAITPLPQN